jgi:hypothetical protein
MTYMLYTIVIDFGMPRTGLVEDESVLGYSAV